MNIARLVALFCSAFLYISIFANTITVGVLESPGAGGLDKTDMPILWNNILLKALNKDCKPDSFTVKHYTLDNMASLEKALNDGAVLYAYVQAPGAVRHILNAEVGAQPVLSLLTFDMQSQKLRPSFVMYLITKQKGIDPNNQESVRKYLAGKTISMPHYGMAKAYFDKENQLNLTWRKASKFSGAVDDVKTGKADAAIVPDRVIRKMNQTGLMIYPLYVRPNGAVLASKQASATTTACVIKTLTAIKPETLKSFLVKGFSAPNTVSSYKEGVIK